MLLVRTRNTIGAHQHVTSSAEHTAKLTFVNLAWNIVRADNCWLNVYDASRCFDINNFMFDCHLHSLMNIFAFFAHITLTVLAPPFNISIC
jgi:hypothetical protein